MDSVLHVTIPNIILASAILHLLAACPENCLCNWKQVKCVETTIFAVPGDIPYASEVESLDLHNNYISSITNVFQNLRSLQRLDLRDNLIQEIHKADFQNNTNLQWLNLQGNFIKEIDAESFRHLTNLTYLNLANNSILELKPNMLQGLESLQHLDLHGNNIAIQSGSALEDISSLKYLDLSFNDIRDINNLFENSLSLLRVNLSHNRVKVFDGQSLHSNNTVTYLNLSHNEVHDVFNMSGLLHLQVLDLSWNNISYISATTFEGLVNLTELALDGNCIEAINTSVFQGLENLQLLSLSMMPNLKYLSPLTFVGLDRLTVLDLHHNHLLSFIHKDLFVPLQSISIINISYNQIRFLHSTVINNTQLTSLDLRGNKLSCDCYIEWLLNSTKSNNSILAHSDELECLDSISNKTAHILDMEFEDLHCSDVTIVHHSLDSKFKIGSSVILTCVAEGSPSPEIIWITPRKRVLHFHNFHEYSTLEYLPVNDSEAHAHFHTSHNWHEERSYHSESEDRSDRIVLMEDGSLYIDYVLRSDGGPYKCIAKNSRNQTEVVINFYLDYSILGEAKIWSLVVGGACAGGFFLLNLIYSLTLAAVRRCISQRRREHIRHIIETMDQYKTHQLSRIKENYNHQVGRIRDQYHYQLGRLRENHQSKVGRMGRMREGASQRVEKLRDNYNNQLGRLKDYSSNQLVQIRDKYNNQIDRIKDYGNDKLDRIHEKYKLKQQHVIKLLEMMNMDNCRTVFESECVRTESMILESDIFNTEVPIHGPLDSDSVSDSEYVTATSSESSKYTSKENLNSTQEDANRDNEVQSVSKLFSSDNGETYQIVNEESNTNADLSPTAVSEEAASSNPISSDQSKGVCVASKYNGKRPSVKSKMREGSRKRRSRSDMVLNLPQDNDEEDESLPANGKRLVRKYPSTRNRASGSLMSQDQPSTSRLSDPVDDIDDILVLPGEVIRESTV